jgi:hypothetical protein
MTLKGKSNCKVCNKEFEYLVSQRKNPTFCNKDCQLKFLRKPNILETIPNKTTISTPPPKSRNIFKQIFPWL